ncbi:dihydrolipoamide dehydrogenase [Geobacter anodireducens]|nr:dihydrolipoamide dehydrogenase [Geobacter anodireducens]
MQTFDVVVIGGGPGGMTAGMMLKQAGKSVAIIQENHDSFGGVCLNRGCMPTKSMLKAAKVYRDAQNSEKYGLDLSVNPVDLTRLRAVADADLNMLRHMVQGKLTDARIAVFRGKGSFRSEHEIEICQADGSSEQIRGEKIIIATGSVPAELPCAPFDGHSILSSDQILKNTELPHKLLIIGGGAIGCEFATLYNTFGSRVTLVEAMDSLLPREDREAGKTLQSTFEQQGIAVKTGAAIKSISVEAGTVHVHYDGSSATEEFDKVLVGIGRTANIAGLNLDAAGVATEQGAVKVNEMMQTTVPHIYALGDVIGGMTLAHAAEKEGYLLAQNLIQGSRHPLDHRAVPRVVFCHPEVAAVGTHEARAGIKAFTMPQAPNGRAVVDKVAPAFVKLFIEEDTSQIAGAIIIGEGATEMIHEMAVAVENRLTLEQIGKTVHAHPTHSKNVLLAVQHFN